jgi:hypothetical protein
MTVDSALLLQPSISDNMARSGSSGHFAEKDPEIFRHFVKKRVAGRWLKAAG